MRPGTKMLVSRVIGKEIRGADVQQSCLWIHAHALMIHSFAGAPQQHV